MNVTCTCSRLPPPIRPSSALAALVTTLVAARATASVAEPAAADAIAAASVAEPAATKLSVAEHAAALVIAADSTAAATGSTLDGNGRADSDGQWQRQRLLGHLGPAG